MLDGSIVMRADMSGSMDGREEDISVWQYGHEGRHVWQYGHESRHVWQYGWS